MRKHFRRSRRRLFSFKAWRLRLVFWVGALVVGIVAVIFARMADIADHSFTRLLKDYPLLPFILTPAGLMLINWLTNRFFTGSNGSGIPQTIAAMDMKNKASVLSFRIAIGKLLLTTMGLFSGASIGREGPTVHIGASIMYSLGKFAKFPAHYYQHGMIAAGGAAGIAAAFNTPLAGIVFALEEISKSMQQRTNGIILTAVIFAGMTAVALMGNYQYFGVSHAVFSMDFSLLLSMLVCGVLGGFLGGAFSQMLIIGNRLIQPWIQRYPMRVTCLLGLVIAYIGFLSGHTSFGTGYSAAYQIVSGEGQVDQMFPVYKFFSTLASYFTGIPGGIFAPSLATGAGIGQNLANLLPLAPASFMILIGMVAYFSGVIQAPITAMVIVLEMTANENMIFPLMITAFLGSGVSSLVCPRPLYRALADSFLYADIQNQAKQKKDQSQL
jgi:H+/Cl- antiporter ClcA